MDIPLTINDIREWLITHAPRYHEQKSHEFPPQEEGVPFELDKFYTTYGTLFEFMRYFQYKSKCDKAISELTLVEYDDVKGLGKWTKKYENLGSQYLVLIDIDYLWDKYKDKVYIGNDLFAKKSLF